MWWGAVLFSFDFFTLAFLIRCCEQQVNVNIILNAIALPSTGASLSTALVSFIKDALQFTPIDSDLL